MTPVALALLDTDTLSEIIKGKHPGLMRKSREYLTTHGHFSFSIMTRYEILRGLKSKGATTKLAAFERFCLANHILSLADPIIVRAAEIYADLKQRGQLISDADILIAATAITHGLTLVTNNTVHYARIGGLALANWKSP